MSAAHTPGPWTAKGPDGKYSIDNKWHAEHETASLSVAAPIMAGAETVAIVVSTDWDDFKIDGNARLISAAPDLYKAARAQVAMTHAEALAAHDAGKELLYCRVNKLNPCWDGSWSDEHGTGKHWGGGDACPDCLLRAAIAKAGGR